MADTTSDHACDHDFFGTETDGNGFEIGIPFDHFVTALGVWVSMQPKNPTVADAMLTFNATLSVVQKACHDHYWIGLSGDAEAPLQQSIFLDGA